MDMPENYRGVFHKEKVAKRKTEVQQPTAISTTGNSTIGKGSTAVNPSINRGQPGQLEQAIEQQQQTLEQSELARAESRSRSIKTLEIDDYLFGLVMEGILDEDWIPYTAKACYTLGLQRVNTIVIQVRSAHCDPNKGQSKHKLFMWKIKGAIQLHYKRQLYEQDRAEP